MGNNGSSPSKEVKHSFDTINKAYEGSPKMALDVITTTLPMYSKEDFNKMHEILEKVKEEDCKDDLCKSTIENVRKSMYILREEHERNPSQLENTIQYLNNNGCNK